uniref:UBC core domain-containing protein n=1 Tax=Pseudo-nitzschia australis TaxID=44445 RepID=A0A6V0BH00_9STRA|mmetsp:Transcript_24369/g.53343  ORF Transcript_24369/g.53343 Transcript_24369/m.53343 type:complete len:605 (-) Transcript_24369:397-2211(-)
MAFKEATGSLFRCFVWRDSSSSAAAKKKKVKKNKIVQRDEATAITTAITTARTTSRTKQIITGTTTGTTVDSIVDQQMQMQLNLSSDCSSSSSSSCSGGNHKASRHVAATIALEARKELESNRRKAYTEVLGSLRMGFVDADGCGYESNDDNEADEPTLLSFDEQYYKFLDEDQKEQERENRRARNQWHHTFQRYHEEEKYFHWINAKNKKNKGKGPSASTSTNAQTQKQTQARLVNVRKLHREYINYASNLPVTSEGSIFVRVPEDRLDLPRVLITGPHDTPYSNGLFFFDCFLKDYPNASPKVQFLTTGNGNVRFNPNLYVCGKVCLSLLGTWNGPGWNSGSSTLLQVLLSLQGLVLGTDAPFFNEPGFGNFKGKPQYQQESNQYNKSKRKQTMKWAILNPLKQIVQQEERVEQRKIFLEQLQLQEKRQNLAATKHKLLATVMEAGQEDPSSACSNDNKNNPEKNENDNCNSRVLTAKKTTTNTSSSTNSKRKKIWSLSVPWSSTSARTTEEGGVVPLISPLDLPPRQDYEYPEFTTIVIRHFVQNADHLQEQLQSWTQKDPSRGTKNLAEEIRKWLKRLLDLDKARTKRNKMKQKCKKKER